MTDAQDEKTLIDKAKRDLLLLALSMSGMWTDIQLYLLPYRSASDAEDLTGKSFSKRWVTSELQAYGFAFSAWLYRIAHKLVANYHRDRSRKQEISLEICKARLLSRRALNLNPACPQQEVENLLAMIRTWHPTDRNC